MTVVATQLSSVEDLIQVAKQEIDLCPRDLRLIMSGGISSTWDDIESLIWRAPEEVLSLLISDDPAWTREERVEEGAFRFVGILASRLNTSP
jgi:hypothetical protein